MGAPWPAPVVRPSPDPVPSGRTVGAWLAFVLGAVGGVLVAWLTLSAWFVWTVVIGVSGAEATSVWLWTLAVVAGLANVLPLVGIVVVERRNGALPYLLMLVPTPSWFLVAALVVG